MNPNSYPSGETPVSHDTSQRLWNVIATALEDPAAEHKVARNGFTEDYRRETLVDGTTIQFLGNQDIGEPRALSISIYDIEFTDVHGNPKRTGLTYMLDILEDNTVEVTKIVAEDYSLATDDASTQSGNEDQPPKSPEELLIHALFEAPKTAHAAEASGFMGANVSDEEVRTIIATVQTSGLV